MTKHRQPVEVLEGKGADSTENGSATSFSVPDPGQDFAHALGKDLAIRCFIGARKQRNEDYGVIARETVNGITYSVLIVSDGVSSSERGHLASEAACISGREAILAKLRGGEPDLESCLRAGIDAAQAAVTAIPCIGERWPWNERKGPPATTFIAAITTGSHARIAWLGDCRAYLVSASGGVRLMTKDHSWINTVVDDGTMTLSEAMHSDKAHMIMECLGQLHEDDALQPSFATVDLTGARMLIVSSDGFWNYAHPRQDAPASPFIAELRTLPKDAEAQAIATRLVDFANERGGHDNITVAVLTLAAPQNTQPSCAPTVVPPASECGVNSQRGAAPQLNPQRGVGKPCPQKTITEFWKSILRHLLR